MSDPSSPDADDGTEFRVAVGPLRELRHDRVEPHRQRPAPIARSRLRDERAVLEELASAPLLLDDLETGEELVYLRQGLQPDLLRKLRRGKFAVSAQIDLHGYTADAARTALGTFLDRCVRREIGCVRVIHGKGLRSSHRGPVLKRGVARWLRQRDDVLAYCSARAVDGGTGAVYALLRCRRLR
jgi:DNA-nicking Smr family endonuclease